MKTRIMYIECKAEGAIGPARIGRVSFSKTGSTLYYAGKSLQSLKGGGSESNYFDIITGEPYWISGPRRDGKDSLYEADCKPEIDADAWEEYWSMLRGVRPPPRTE